MRASVDVKKMSEIDYIKLLPNGIIIYKGVKK